MGKKSVQKTPAKQEQKKSKKVNFLYIGTVIIFIIIIVTFIGGPILSSQVEGSSISFGSYAGEEIRYIQGSYFANSVAHYSNIIGRNLSVEDESYNTTNRFIWKESFDQTVSFLASLNLAKASNLLISESEVNNEIISSPRFTTEDGVFLMENYNNISQQELFELRKGFSESLTVDRIRQDLSNRSFSSSQEKQYILDMDTIRKDIRAVEFTEDQYPDELVIEYVQNNSALVQSRELSSITIRDEFEEVERLYEEIVANPSSFEENARLYSTDEFASRGGQRGEIFAYELLDLLSEEDVSDIFSPERLLGDITNVFSILETENSYVIFQIAGDIQPFDNTNQENFDQIRAYISSEEPDLIADYVQQQIQDFLTLAQETSFLEASIVNDIDYFDFDSLPLSYSANSIFDRIDTSEFPTLFTAYLRDDFLEELHSLDVGEISVPIAVRNTTLIFTVRDIQNTPQEEIDLLALEYENRKDAYIRSELEGFIVRENLLKDNFTETFNEFLLHTPTEDEISNTQNDDPPISEDDTTEDSEPSTTDETGAEIDSSEETE